ncbi:hypothetical protein ACULNC_25725 [Shigella flexneri]
MLLTSLHPAKFFQFLAVAVAYIKSKILMLCLECTKLSAATLGSILFGDFFLFGLILAFASLCITTLLIDQGTTPDRHDAQSPCG